MKVAIVSGTCLVLAAVVAGIFSLLGADKAPGEQASTSPTVTANPTPSCRFAITHPASRARVNRTKGAVIDGTACKGDQIWVFDYDTDEDLYYRDTDTPVRVTGGTWSFEDSPIGDDGDPSGTHYDIAAVRTNASCSDAIRKLAKNRDGDVKLKVLPNNCPDLAGTDVRSLTLISR